MKAAFTEHMRPAAKWVAADVCVYIQNQILTQTHMDEFDSSTARNSF